MAKKTQDSELGIDELGYSEALAELETILKSLESDSVDVDVLATKVQGCCAHFTVPGQNQCRSVAC